MLNELFPYGVIIGFILMVVLYTIGMFAGIFAGRLHSQAWQANRSQSIIPAGDPIATYGPWVGALFLGIILSYLLYHFIGWLGS